MEVGVYEAKTHFARFVERVTKGERITITKHGKAVAELRPVQNQIDPSKLGAVLTQMAAYRKDRGRRKNPLTVKEIIAAKNEGRR